MAVRLLYHFTPALDLTSSFPYLSTFRTFVHIVIHIAGGVNADVLLRRRVRWIFNTRRMRAQGDTQAEQRDEQQRAREDQEGA